MSPLSSPLLPVTLLLLALAATHCQDLPREAKKLVKKVRRLGGGGGSAVSSCPVFDGVQVTADPASCNQFYKCENGSMTLETCENGLLYDQEMSLTDAIHNYCVYSWRVECGERPADRAPVSSPGCPFRFGLFPDGEGCQSSYIKCEHGQPTQVTAVRSPNIDVTQSVSRCRARQKTQTCPCRWASPTTPRLTPATGQTSSLASAATLLRDLEASSVLNSEVGLFH